MIGRISFSRVALKGLCVLALGLAPAAAQEEARPTPKTIGEGLRLRRVALLELEESVQALRDEEKVQLTDAVAGQQIAIVKADKELQAARVAREKAEYTLKEYVQGIYLQDHATFQGEIALARSDLGRAKDELDGIEKLGAKDRVDPIQLLRAQLTQQQAEFDLEQAETKLKVLVEYTKDRKIKTLEKAIEAAKAVEAEKEGLLSAEREKEKKLREQAGQLKARSPEDLVLALLDDAIALEGKVVTVVRDLQTVEAQIRDKPSDAANLAPQLTAKKAEADSLMTQAKNRLLDAALLGEQVKKLRAGLREAEARLKRERELMDRLEREMAPTRP